MTDFKSLLDIVDALQAPILAFIAWRVYRLETNHLPHISEKLDEMNERLSRLEGRNERIDGRRHR